MGLRFRLKPGFRDSRHDLRPKLRLQRIQRLQLKPAFQRQTQMHAGNRLLRRQHHQRRPGLLHQGPQPAPVIAGQTPNFAHRRLLQIQHHMRQVPIAQQPIRRLHGVRDFSATHPEKPRAGLRAERLRIEAIAPVDQCQMLPLRRHFSQQTGQNQPRTATFSRTHDFGNLAPRDPNFIQRLDPGFEQIARFRRFVAMGFGEALAQQTAQLDDFVRGSRVHFREKETTVRRNSCFVQKFFREQPTFLRRSSFTRQPIDANLPSTAMASIETTTDDSPEVERVYAQTRQSLIERLKDWEDQRSWDEFYQTYWRLIYSVATKAGLRADEASEVVQETVLSIAKQQQKAEKGYDREKGSFKSWLLQVTRWRIADQFRKRQRDQKLVATLPEDESSGTGALERFADPDGPDIEKEWDAEWNRNLTKAALHRVKNKVAPKQFQIFDCYVVKGWETGKVQEELGVSLTQVYLAKHRVGKLVKQEIETLQQKLL